MRKTIFKVCQWLHFHKLLPWSIWSPVYDKWHRQIAKSEWVKAAR